MMFKPEWRRILELRSIKDKIVVAIDCDLADPADLPILTELVREDIIVWTDRTVLPMIVRFNGARKLRVGINADVYQLTLKGIALCNENGIEQQ